MPVQNYVRLAMFAGSIAALGAMFAWWRSSDQLSDSASPITAADADRASMVRAQLATRGIVDPRVLGAMGRVPRERFVPADREADAYADSPLSIGHGQTISQPYIVALMTERAQIDPHDRVLDVGTGSGYQAAVLAELCKEVYSIEIVPELAATAAKRIAEQGYKNVRVRTGDGYRGWPEHAPFDAIILAAAPDHVPQPLVDQLANGGRLIMPVGTHAQSLVLIEKQADGSIRREHIASVAFVPMTGEAEGDRTENVDD